MIAIDETQAINNTLPKDWRKKRLSDVCIINPLRPPTIGRRSSELTSFVPMSAVDEIRGVIAKYEKRPFSDIAKGYTYFGEGDVLFAKITPCMQNGKHAIASGLTDGIGFGSTEFHIMRHGCEITSEWIHYYIRQTRILSEAMSHFTGSVGQQRVPETFLANLYIPLPPLDEQKRIVSILNEQMAAVEKARLATQERLKAARALPDSYMRAAFDSSSVRAWPKRRLGDICEVVAKQVDPRVHEYGQLPHVNGENIESGTGRITYLKTAAELGMISGKYLFEPGDVLYSKLRPYLRKVTIVDYRGVCSADMYPIRFDHTIMEPKFAAWMLLSDDFTKYADEESRRARMPKLNRDQLFSYKASVPPLDEQREIISRLDKLFTASKKLNELLSAELVTVAGLPAVLLGRAFKGGI